MALNGRFRKDTMFYLWHFLVLIHVTICTILLFANLVAVLIDWGENMWLFIPPIFIAPAAILGICLL